MDGRQRLIAIFLVVCCGQLAAEDNWTRFRGKDGTGVAVDHSALPLTWSTSENVSWVADIPGWERSW